MTRYAYAVSITMFVRPAEGIDPDVLITELLENHQGFADEGITWVIDDVNLWTPRA